MNVVKNEDTTLLAYIVDLWRKHVNLSDLSL